MENGLIELNGREKKGEKNRTEFADLNVDIYFLLFFNNCLNKFNVCYIFLMYRMHRVNWTVLLVKNV